MTPPPNPTEQKVREILNNRNFHWQCCNGDYCESMSEDEKRDLDQATAEIMKLHQEEMTSMITAVTKAEVEEIARLRPLCLTLGRALNFAQKKRTYQGTAQMIMGRMEKVLNEIATEAKEALSAMPEEMRKEIDA